MDHGILEMILTPGEWWSPQTLTTLPLRSPGVGSEWQASGHLLSLQISSVTPGFFSGYVPGQELEGSVWGCEGKADLVPKLRRNPG